MIVDTSAIMAIAKGESDAELYASVMADATTLRMSAGNWIELAVVTTRAGDQRIIDFADEVIEAYRIVIEPVTVEMARLARQAYAEFGQTRHPAKLNFGDCFAFALANAYGEPLLFKGEDFRKAGMKRAW